MELISLDQKKSKKSRRAIIFILVIILLFGSFQLGLYYGAKDSIFKKVITAETLYLGGVTGLKNENKPEQVGSDVDFKLFWETWDVIKQNYVDKDKLTDKQMFYGALSGLVSSAGDPYTVFMDPVVTKEFDDDLSGTFEGIGEEIGMKKMF